MTSISPATPWHARSRSNGNHRQSTNLTQSGRNNSKPFPSFTIKSLNPTTTATGGRRISQCRHLRGVWRNAVVPDVLRGSGRAGQDAHGKLIIDALEGGGVRTDHVNEISQVPTGHAVVMLQSDGQNSIIIVGGANMCGWPDDLDNTDLEIVKNAGIVLLQREIPDSINIQVAKAARSAGVPVILDAGGMDAPVPVELLKHVDILSPNESELARLTGMQTESFEQISLAVAKCHKLGVKEVLVKLGGRGSVLFIEGFIEGKEPIKQGIIEAEKVLDTTGIGDTFTAAYAVAFVEGKSKAECLRFAAAAASLCVRVKGAIPSMPHRKAVLDLLQSV
ncbi:hypothetical protein L1987_78292 [Smallanthus sonchifolius]|uniref:Uncharacterized protein n=1 Tax=Smallanthus sonchifolius TaxID=185202 RepID=A0ACB8ZBZ0_9ASTR|nr:hypothetical protein L1987_78292 [Smallanthus sonchifolius]